MAGEGFALVVLLRGGFDGDRRYENRCLRFDF